jgi:hypothetical protein
MALIDIIMRAKDETNGVLEDGAEQMDEMDEKAKGLTSTLKGMRGPALAVTGVLTGLGIAGIKFATDLGEAQNKANEVFGTSVDVVQEFARTSARDFGISAAAANEYAGTLGLILNASGLTQQASADMSVDLVKLSADLASFGNIPIDVALEKLRAGLVGEVEPLRTVGVLLNAATVEAKAMELGLVDASGELSEAAKVQARYALIVEQTATAQGDFGRTSDSVANQMRILKAQGEDLLAVMGTELLPVAGKLLEWAINMAAAFINLPRPIRLAVIAGTALAGVLAGLVLVLPPLIAGFGALGVAVATLSGPLGILALVGALTAGVVGYNLFTNAMNEATIAAERQQEVAAAAAAATIAQQRAAVEANEAHLAGLIAERDELKEHREELVMNSRAWAENLQAQLSIEDQIRVVNGVLDTQRGQLERSEAAQLSQERAVAEAEATIREYTAATRDASIATASLSASQIRAAITNKLMDAVFAETTEEMDALQAEAEILGLRLRFVEGIADDITAQMKIWTGANEEAETQTRRTSGALGEYASDAERAARKNDELADSFKRVSASVESLKLPTLGEIVDARTGLLAGNELSPLESTIRALLGSAPSVNISADSTLAQQLDALAQEGLLIRESGSGTRGEDSRAIFSVAPGQEEALASALFGVQAPPTMTPQITINVEGSILTEQDLQSVVVGAIDSAGEAGRTS